MASSGMYFGTRDRMEWINCPRVGMPRNAQRLTSQTDFGNGGAHIYQGPVGSRSFDMEWKVQSFEEVRHVIAVQQGLYSDVGTSADETLVHWLDPASVKTNVLPPMWASPLLAFAGAPSIAGPVLGQPTLTGVSSTEGYPTNEARWGASGNIVVTDSPELWIPVPAGYTFHMGLHNNAGAHPSSPLYLRVTPDGGSPTNLTPLGLNTTTLTNYSYTPVSDSGVTVQLQNGTGKFNATGMVAQILKAGAPAPVGKFYPGQGNSGCRITQFEEDLYSTAISGANVYLSATLVETGSWTKQ